MFGTIRKHQTWLWLVIIGVTIVSFVIFFSPTSKLPTAGRRSYDYGSIEGTPVSENAFEEARREFYLNYFFRYHSWPDKDRTKITDEDRDRETYFRLFMIQKLKDYDIRVSSEAAAQLAAETLRSFGRGQAVSLDLFVQRVLAPYAGTDDFMRYLQHELGIQQLISVIGLSGELATPQEIHSVYERYHQELATAAVFFSGSNYLAEATAAPAAVAQFYTNHQADYRLPDRRQVSYVEFGVTNIWAAAEKELDSGKTNLNEKVELTFRDIGTNYLRLAATPEAAKAKIREELIREQALRQAYNQANEFATVLFGIDPPRPENLATLAKTNGLAVKVTEPFDETDGPKDLKVGADFAKTAFSLSPTNDPFAGPLAGADGVYILAYNKEIPSEIPPLDRIRDQVTADYKFTQAVLLAREAGTNFVRALTNGLARGKTFFEVCAEAKIKSVSVPPFSLSTRELPEVEDHISLNQYKQIAFTTPPGKVSGFNLTRDGGVVVDVQQQLPLDPAKMQEDMPAFLHYIRQQRMQEAFNVWFNREASAALRNTPPFLRARQPALKAGQGPR